jgi:hypothetical protein
MSSDAPIPPAVIAENVAELRKRVAATEAELEQLRTQLDWWETGQRLFGDDTEAEPKAEPASTLPEGSSDGGRPSLREAVLTVLSQEPVKTWKTEAVIEELRKRDWLPNGKYGEHHTRSMLAQMHRKGQARRMGRGLYRLPPSAKGVP